LQLDNCPDFGLLDNCLDHICGTTVRRRRRLSGVLGLRLGLPRRGLVVVVVAAAVAAVVSSVIVALNRRPDAPVDGASIAIIPVAPIVNWPAIVVPISAAIAVTTPAVPVVVAQVIVAPIPSPATLNLSVILATAIEVAVAIEVTVSVIATVATAALGIAAAAVHVRLAGLKKVQKARSFMLILTTRKQHSQHTNTHKPNSKARRATPRTRHSRFILMLATCNACRAHRHGSARS